MKSYDTLDEVRDYLVPLGFTEYNPSPFDSECICTNFQKKYVDDNGAVKYFITAHTWDYSWTKKIPENYIIEFTTQLYNLGNHNAVDLTFIDWDIGQIEEWVEKLFENKMVEDYEK